ncbi:hypothetical protein SCHPADRAFT_939763 [Schizopora paradoxa]|uniref:Protein transport protein SFT2 n=1 Tax=Schizopora paradoxa TaxID=27342 RepID=A0A0H2RQG3_9AGAM|nr:hypothetical protein SCHPADRAFT_939763 [Schizopora paradoxa]
MASFLKQGWLNTDASMFLGDHAFSWAPFELTPKRRLYGWAIWRVTYSSALLGFVLSLLGTIWLLVGSLTLFAIFYAFGVVVSLFGTGFIIGFFRQFKMMFNLEKPTRVIASVAFLGFTGLIFVGAFVIDNGIICIIFVICQYAAYWFYIMTYIPGASLWKYIAF